MVRPCISELDEKMACSQHKFTINVIEDTFRYFTSFPMMDKIKYYECLEESIKDIISQFYNIQIEDIFESEYNVPFLKDLCFYVKGIVEQLQKMNFLWFIEDTDEIILEKNAEGNISKVITGENVDYQKAFKLFMSELKQECYHMEGYNIDVLKLKKENKGE